MNRKINLYCLIIFCGSLISAWSCGKNIESQNVKFLNFGSSGMIADKDYIFEPFEEIQYDSLTISKYDIAFIIRYNDKCNLKTLPLKIETTSFNFDTIYNSQITVNLFDDKNNNSGKGGLGFYETIVPFADNEAFDKGLSFAISTPEKSTKGIISLGVACNPVPIDFNKK